MHLNIAQMKTNKLQIYAFVVNIYKKSHFSNNNTSKIQVLLCYKLAMVYLLSVVDIYVWVTPVETRSSYHSREYIGRNYIEQNIALIYLSLSFCETSTNDNVIL